LKCVTHFYKQRNNDCIFMSISFRQISVGEVKIHTCIDKIREKRGEIQTIAYFSKFSINEKYQHNSIRKHISFYKKGCFRIDCCYRIQSNSRVKSGFRALFLITNKLNT
jgi:hypothetical protein